MFPSVLHDWSVLPYRCHDSSCNRIIASLDGAEQVGSRIVVISSCRPLVSRIQLCCLHSVRPMHPVYFDSFQSCPSDYLSVPESVSTHSCFPMTPVPSSVYTKTRPACHTYRLIRICSSFTIPRSAKSRPEARKLSRFIIFNIQ